MHTFFFLKGKPLIWNDVVTQRSGIYPSSIYYVFRNLLGTGRDKSEQSLLAAKLRVPRVFLSYFLEKNR